MTRARCRTAAILPALAVAAMTGCGGGGDPTSPAAPAVGESTVERDDGTALRVREVGPADADDVVIAVHGGPGLTLVAMEPYEDLASDDRRVVSYDQRVTGDVTLEDHVADLEAVRVSVDADRVTILGQSWGGVIASAYAATHPDRVEGVVLVGSIPLDPAAFLEGQARFRARVEALQAEGLVVDPLPATDGGSCAAAFRAVVPAYLADPSDDLDVDPGPCDARASRASYEAFVDSPSVARLAAALAAYDGRALLLMGAEDPFGLEWLDRNAELLAGADVDREVVAGAGHLLAVERPAPLLDAIRAWLGG